MESNLRLVGGVTWRTAFFFHYSFECLHGVGLLQALDWLWIRIDKPLVPRIQAFCSASSRSSFNRWRTIHHVQAIFTDTMKDSTSFLPGLPAILFENYSTPGLAESWTRQVIFLQSLNQKSFLNVQRRCLIFVFGFCGDFHRSKRLHRYSLSLPIVTLLSDFFADDEIQWAPVTMLFVARESMMNCSSWPLPWSSTSVSITAWFALTPEPLLPFSVSWDLLIHWN